jgi:hypothetical protein
MSDKKKYLNTSNLGREDGNKFGLRLDDIVHISGSYSRANAYNYCGYEPFDIPAGSRARIIGIKQTNLNNTYSDSGVGDVYVDYELIGYTNSDGTPITCGNRHAGVFAETSPDFALCPDGSGEPGFIRDGNRRNAGLWESIQGVRIDDDPAGYMQWRPKKLVDPKQYTSPVDGHQEYLTVSSLD